MPPTSATGLVIFLLFVVPGFVHQATRIAVRGRLPVDLDITTRIVRAVVTSGLFGLGYLVVLGDLVVAAGHGEGYAIDHPRIGALLALLGGFVAPALLALIPSPRWRWLTRPRARLPDAASYDPTPTAWDKAFQSAAHCYVRVLTNDDRWIAGYYGSSSYATSYPEPQQLYVEKALEVSEDGTIGNEVEGSTGMIVDCSAIQLVQLLTASTVREDDTHG